MCLEKSREERYSDCSTKKNKGEKCYLKGGRFGIDRSSEKEWLPPGICHVVLGKSRVQESAGLKVEKRDGLSKNGGTLR